MSSFLGTRTIPSFLRLYYIKIVLSILAPQIMLIPMDIISSVVFLFFFWCHTLPFSWPLSLYMWLYFTFSSGLLKVFILFMFFSLKNFLSFTRVMSFKMTALFILAETHPGEERKLARSKDRIYPLFTQFMPYSPPKTFHSSLLRVVDSLVFEDLCDLVSRYFSNFTSHCSSNSTLHFRPTELPNSSPATMCLCTQMAWTGIPWAPLHWFLSHSFLPRPNTHPPVAIILQDNQKIYSSFALSLFELWTSIISLILVSFALNVHTYFCKYFLSGM